MLRPRNYFQWWYSESFRLSEMKHNSTQVYYLARYRLQIDRDEEITPMNPATTEVMITSCR